MNVKFRFEFFDTEEKKVIKLCFEPEKKFSTQTEAWLTAMLKACDIAAENQWILLVIDTYFIGEKEVS